MKLKEKNDLLQEVVEASLKELSTSYSQAHGEQHIFEFWHNMRAKDLDGNQCFRGVVDVRIVGNNDKVQSFKNVYDRMIVQRPNIGTKEQPKYGKQANYEEARYKVLRELIGKSIAAFALAMAMRAKEQIEEFYKSTTEPITEEEVLALGYKHNYVIPEKFKNADGTYSVPDDPKIPARFWGQIVTSKEIVWNDEF